MCNGLTELHGKIESFYGNAANIPRFERLIQHHKDLFGSNPVQLFSTPGRTEIGGNHTDHNNGRVLAAAIDLDSIAVASANNTNKIVVYSEGYEKPFEIDVSQTAPVQEEEGSSAALIRGVVGGFRQRNHAVGGLSACVTSEVLPGSGLSSSASFEVLIGTIINYLFNNGTIEPDVIAKTGQYAENTYFGKPCGLMDQIACANGGIVMIDFGRPEDPSVEKMRFDLDGYGFALVIVDTGGNHANLTEDYAAVRREMKEVARVLGYECARQIGLDELMAHNRRIRKMVGDRAFLRVLHFIEENRRVVEQATALKREDLGEFLRLVNESGNSSYKYLQNAYTTQNVSEQGVSLALALSEKLLRERGEGACRVHGGGFAGTIQVFLPAQDVHEYETLMEGLFGSNCTKRINLREAGTSRIVRLQNA